MIESPYLVPAQAAEYLHISEDTLAKMRLVGGGPRFRYHGRGKRAPCYTREALDAWSAKQERGSTSELAKEGAVA